MGGRGSKIGFGGIGAGGSAIPGGGGGGGLAGGGAGGGTPPVSSSTLGSTAGGLTGAGMPGGPGGSGSSALQVPLSLENFDTYQRDWEVQEFGGFSESEKQYLHEQFRTVFEHNGFYMNIKSQYLENCADEHFKNQFETGGCSGGAEYDASDMTPGNGRVAAAVQLFGLDYTRMQREDYEKYGSMQTLDLATAAARSPAGYGDALVRFKRENVWDRTTYTIGDSLWPATECDLVAGKVSSAQFTGIAASDAGELLSRVKQAESLVTDAQKWNKAIEGGWSSYLEVQYHGSLTMHDVECIVFTKPGSIPGTRVLNKLRSYGVKLYKYEGGTINAM